VTESVFVTHPLAAITAILYAVAGAVSALSIRPRWRSLVLAGLALLAAAFLLNTAVIVGRWVEAGRPPFKTRFETLLLYPWCVAAVTLVLYGLHRLVLLVPFSAACATICLAYGLANPDLETVFLMPALQSGWFVPHVVTYFVSYAALFASCALAALALAAPLWARKGDGDGEAPAETPSGPWTADALAAHAHKAVAFGVVSLTFGLVMGAAWAKFAWGDYWTWDPKENWSLITWLAYMAYLHLRRMPGWQGRRGMWLLVASFGAVMFTWLCMHWLPTAGESLHVYQEP
jgi:cytochrome c-type biogenesis protein CcsB